MTFNAILKCLIISSLVILLVVLSTVLFLVWSLDDISFRDPGKEMCLNDKAFGCGQTKTILLDFMEKKTNKHNRELTARNFEEIRQHLKGSGVQLMELYKDYFRDMKPAGKVTGSSTLKAEDKESNASMSTINSWCAGRKLPLTTGYLRYGVQYQNGRLIIPVSGKYFVHSHIEFYEDTNDNKTLKQKPLKHGMYRFNVRDFSQEEEIISKTYSHEISTNVHFSYYSSYISCLVNLHAGEEISVKISDISMLRDRDENFFGVHLI